MDVNIELEISELPSKVQTHIQQIVKKNSSLSSQYAKELGTALIALAVLPFKDEIQRENFFEKIQSLQGYHIIKIFNLGVASRHKSAKESSAQILEDVTKMFDICVSFCYTSEVSKRVSFDLYINALKFCFPSDNEQSLPITVLSLLLELVQTFQHGNIRAELESHANFMTDLLNITTNDFFGKILDVFEMRRHDGYLIEIINQTVRLATADEKLAIKLVKNARLQGKLTLSSFLLVNWTNLLKLASVSNCFAVSLAEIDLSGEKIDPFFSGEIFFRTYEFPYQSTISYFWKVLEDINKNCRDLRIPNDKDRMEIFSSHVSHFCVHPKIASSSLQLLAAKRISNEVLRQTLEVFFQKHRNETDFTEEAFELILKVSLKRLDSELLKEIMEFWKCAFSADPGHASLVCLLGLFEDDPTDERAKRIINFLERLPRPLLLLMPFWQKIFCWLMKIFPKSFDIRPEVLALIQRAAFLALQLPQEQGQLHFANAIAQVGTVQFLQWLREQVCTEEAKGEMIFLFTSIIHSETVNHRLATTLDARVLISLHFCKQLSFSSKLNIVRQLISLEPRLQEPDQKALKLSIESNASSPECTGEIFCEIFALVKNFVDGKGPKITAKVFFETLFCLSTVPISNDRRLKVIKNIWKSESETGFESSRCILLLLKSQAAVLRDLERGDEYFDLLVHVVLETLSCDFGLCQQLFYALGPFFKFPSPFVLNVWTSAVAGLISLGLYKKNIDLFCCLPVLQNAHGFNSPFEVLQLLFLARSTALTLSRRCGPKASSQALSIGGYNHLGNFINASTIILGTDTFSTKQKMLLVEKVRDVLLYAPQISTALTHALRRLIPYISGREEVQAKFDHIIAILSKPKLVNELSRILKVVNTDDLFRVMSKHMSDVSSEVKSLEVLLFMASLQDITEELLIHLSPFVKMIIVKSSSMEDALGVLKELVQLLRQVPTEMIPFMLINFAYFIGNPVGKQERDKFLLGISMRRKISPSHELLSFLEVPRLLWKAYNTIGDPAKIGELIGRGEEIISRNETSLHEWMVNENFVHPLQVLRVGLPETASISRRIACCELEWLVFHSPLSNKDAAFAFDLSCLFAQTPGYRRRCSSLSDVRIEDGGFKFERDETAPEVLNRRTCAPLLVEGGSMKTQEAVLIPVLMAQKVITCLRRLLGQMEKLAENVLSVWKLLCEAQQEAAYSCGCDCVFDDYQNIFDSVLAEASSKEVVSLWASQNPHHVVQWSEVILSACRWQRKEIRDTGNEAVLKFQTLVITTLLKVQPHVQCFRDVQLALKHLSIFLERQLPIEVTTGVLELYQVDIQAGVNIGEILSSWSSVEQSLTLLEKVRSYYREGEMLPSDFVWQLLKSFVRHGGIDSCEGVLAVYEHLQDLSDPEDPYGLNRLPTWQRAMMVAEDYTARSIDSWCVAFLKTPLVDLKSRDIDAIANLDFDALQLVAPVSETIKRVIFPEDGFQVTEGEGIKSSSIRERIRLAKLIGDFIEILRLLKPSENPKVANVTDIVVGACNKLCTTFESGRKKSELYEIRGKALKAIFTEIFLSEKGSKDFLMTNPRTRLQENATPSVLRNSEHLDPVLEPLLRRWLLGIVGKRPSLASLTLEILQLLPSDVDLAHRLEFQDDIQTHILSFERNQSLMARLQAVGYNRREQDNPDLWSSPRIELSCFLSNRESSSRRTYRKKLREVLRSHWYGWTDLLSMFKVDSVEVGGVEVRREDLFGFQASLEVMEEQVAAVKEKARKLSSAPINLEFFSSPEEIDGQIKNLICGEQRYRRKIAKLYDHPSIPDKRQEMKKFAAVWENRFLEQVNQCSGRIPGCYAPNGFHAEKPVICALSVDNRMLTVFKEKNGRREEIENVEVKLFEVGMFVYGLHTSGHDYVTDELWAAFYKMLLEKGLVPRIVLSPESPGFDWIRNFATPDTSLPFPGKWELHTGIVPKQEDVFDYVPTSRAMWHGSTEFITLTTESVAGFRFSDFKDASIVEEKEKRTQQMAGTAIKRLQLELKLLHADDEKTKTSLVKKLTSSIKETVKGILAGVQPTLETVKELIDMEKLAFGLSKVKGSDECKQQYATAVLRACEHARLTFASTAVQ